MYKQNKVVSIFKRHCLRRLAYLNFVKHLFDNLFFKANGQTAKSVTNAREAQYSTTLQEIEPEIDAIIKDDVERLDSLKQLQESDQKLYGE